MAGVVGFKSVLVGILIVSFPSLTMALDQLSSRPKIRCIQELIKLRNGTELKVPVHRLDADLIGKQDMSFLPKSIARPTKGEGVDLFQFADIVHNPVTSDALENPLANKIFLGIEHPHHFALIAGGARGDFRMFKNLHTSLRASSMPLGKGAIFTLDGLPWQTVDAVQEKIANDCTIDRTFSLGCSWESLQALSNAGLKIPNAQEISQAPHINFGNILERGFIDSSKRKPVAISLTLTVDQTLQEFYDQMVDRDLFFREQVPASLTGTLRETALFEIHQDHGFSGGRLINSWSRKPPPSPPTRTSAP